MRHKIKAFVAFFIFCFLLISLFLYLRPLPAVSSSAINLKSAASDGSLPWPAYGQGAVFEKSFGLLATNGELKALPMASTAKIITALAVVKQKPLKINEQGPAITISQDDVNFYNSYYGNDGSVAKVTLGEQISEYQTLEAMLLPSANNMADSLARWAFGSMDAYVKYANQMLDSLHLPQTRVADASGFSKDSVSTAEDLAKLGEALMDNEVLAQIVGQETADIPIAGKVSNVNWLLGSDGVVGIKTGNTAEAGGCFVFAARHTVLGQKMTFVGALIGAPTRNQAIADSRTILRSIDDNFEIRTTAKKGQVLGSYSAPWGTTAEVTVPQDFSFIAWKGWSLDIKTEVRNLSGSKPSGTEVGSLKVELGRHSASQKLVLKDKLEAPPWTWRLLR